MRKIFLILLLMPWMVFADDYINIYYTCIKDNVRKYSVTGESAEAIASASVTSCGAVLYKSFTENPAFYDASPEAKQSAMQGIKEQGRELGIKYAMDIKLQSHR
ncbi:TPA: hypothetical protein ACG33R_001422 [Escherichia coli]